MQKKIIGICPIQKGIQYSVLIDYVESKTNEGIDYAKGTLACKFNNTYKTCRREKCPIWLNAPERP